MRVWWQQRLLFERFILVSISLVIIGAILYGVINNLTRPSYSDYQSSGEVFPTVSGSQGGAVQRDLAGGKKCTAKWTANSSKPGVATDITGVRVLDGKTQFNVYHSPEQGRIWTWEDRLSHIRCK